MSYPPTLSDSYNPILRMVHVKQVAERLEKDPSGESAVRYLEIKKLDGQRGDDIFREAESRAYPDVKTKQRRLTPRWTK
jgi:hypothetical protein